MDWNVVLSIALGGGVAGGLTLYAFSHVDRLAADRDVADRDVVLERLAKLDETVPMSMPSRHLRHLRHLD